jgi:hypothetical protein
MAKISHQIMTANRLEDGVVVYLDAQERWVENLSAAAIAETKADAKFLTARAAVAVGERRVVGPYLFPVEPGAARARPLSQREHIRALGPTVGNDFSDSRTGG